MTQTCLAHPPVRDPTGSLRPFALREALPSHAGCALPLHDARPLCDWCAVCVACEVCVAWLVCGCMPGGGGAAVLGVAVRCLCDPNRGEQLGASGLPVYEPST